MPNRTPKFGVRSGQIFAVRGPLGTIPAGRPCCFWAAV